MTPVPPSKVEQDGATRSSSDQHGTRTKIVEILASTANGCIAELGYHPSMSQALKELEQRNTQWQMENIKLFEDNRNLARMLHLKNAQINELETMNRRVSHERDHFKDLWEGKVMGPTIPVIEYQRLRTAYKLIDEKYRYWKQEFLRIQRVMDAMMMQNHAQPPLGPAPSPLPPPTSGLPTSAPTFVPTQSSPYPHHPMYQMSSFPQGSHPAQMQGQPRHPPHQAQTMQIQHSYVAKRSPPGGPIQIPPHYAHLVSSSYQRRSNDIHPTLVPLVATDKGQAAQTKEIREMNTVAHNPRQIANYKREAQSPHITQSMRNLASFNAVVPKSEHRSDDVTLTSIPADQPLTPMSAVALDMENSNFVKQQATPRLITPHESPVELPSTPPIHSPESQIPSLQDSLLLAPGTENMPNTAALPTVPELTSSSSVSPQSSGQSNPSEVATPDAIDHDSTKLVSSPVIGMDSMKRVRDESPDDAGQDDGPRKKQRVEDEASAVLMQPVEAEDEVEEEEENEDEDDTPIEVGPDGLRTEKSCLSVLFAADENNEGLKTCALCQGRYDLGAVEGPPKPFEGASETELVQHCINEHYDAWDALRNDVG